jgi:hypothetical protein
MARGDFGIAGEIELAEMAALPPLPQVIADMGRPGLVGSRRSSARVHGENLACDFRTFHYVGGNRIADADGSSSQQSTTQPRRPTMIHPSLFLRRAILADAIFSGVSALLLTFGAGQLAPWLDLPESLLRETGLFLIAYTTLVGWLGTRQSMPKALVAIVIAGNAAWMLASIALLFSGAVTPNLLGEAFVLAQAIAVGALAELQYIGLRKSGGALAA